MTLDELLGCLLILNFGLIGAMYGSRKFGPLGCLLGIPAALAAVGLMFLWAWVSDLLFRGNPYLPACRRGRCRAADYEFGRLASGYPVWRCRCGDGYARRGARFVDLDEEGAERPYLRWVPLCGWREDV